MHEDTVISAASDAVTADAIANEATSPRADDRKSVFASTTEVTTCSNCETPLQGRFCHRCGQVADTWHRPIWSLFSEVLEGVFGMDGRLWRTIPALLFRPGHVTRNYLSGKRQRYIPPFRMFLFASLIFFLAFELTANHNAPALKVNDTGGAVSEAKNAEAARKLQDSADELDKTISEPPAGTPEAVKSATSQLSRKLRDAAAQESGTAAAATNSDTQQKAIAEIGQDGGRERMICGVRKVLVPEKLSDRCREKFNDTYEESTDNDAKQGNIQGKASNMDLTREAESGNNVFMKLNLQTREHLAGNFADALRDPDRYFRTLTRWAPRVGFVLAPVFALLLAMTFFWRKGVYLYDHLVVSLHYHAFLYLFLTLLIPFGMFNGPGWPIAVFLLWSNFYLYWIQRRVYDCGRFTSVLRVLFLDTMYGIVLLLAMLALLMLGVVFM